MLLIWTGFFLFSAAIATAQVGSASLSGVVQDQTGAAVPGATVTLENPLTGIPWTATSNGAGGFSFAAVPSGDYDLKVEKAGFAKFVQKDIHLDPGDSKTLSDIRLPIGAQQVGRVVRGDVALDTRAILRAGERGKTE